MEKHANTKPKKTAENNCKSKDDKLRWYMRKGYKSSIIFQTTPGSKLKRNISQRLKREGLGDKFQVLIPEKYFVPIRHYQPAATDRIVSPASPPPVLPNQGHQTVGQSHQPTP